MSKLGIISTEENIVPGSNLCISSDREYSGLLVKENEEWVDVKESQRSISRPLHASELNKALVERGFNYGFIPFAMTDASSLYIGYENSNVVIPPLSLLQGLTGGMKRMKISSETEEEISQTKVAVKRIKSDEVYSKILEEMDEKEINLFTASTSSVDLVSGIRTIDLLTVGDDSYTNMVSLIPLKSAIIGEGINAKVDLSILYTVASGGSGVTYSYSTYFPAFAYTSTRVEEENWIEEVRNLVQIEYINGIIRVLPLSSNVTECIISQCTVEYGRDNSRQTRI